MRRALDRCLHEHRAVTAAVLVGAVLRVGWLLAAGGAPPRLSDPWRYQRMADQLAAGGLPTSAGEPTALFPVGYPLALAGPTWIAHQLGLSSTAAVAAVVDLVAGTATIALGALLAREWFGDRAARAAAWLLAVGVPLITWTSSGLSETLATAQVLGALLWATRAVDRRSGRRSLIGLGVLVGWATLVRSPGLVLLLAVPLVHLGRRRPLRAALAPTALVVAGAAIVLGPWTVRNAVQVDVVTPLSTNNAAFLCLGNGPGADGTSRTTATSDERCWRGSPVDRPELYLPGEVPDGWVHQPEPEGDWYRRVLRETTSWILEHPGEQPRLVWGRLHQTFWSESQALSDGEGFGERRAVDGALRTAVERTSLWWWWGVLVLGGLALAVRPSARGAVPLWATSIALVLALATGIGLQRYAHSIVALAAVLAAALVEQRAGAPSPDATS